VNPKRRIALLTLVLGSILSGLSAEPQVSNRSPQPDEWGYRPADGDAVGLNPPSLTWLVETGAVTYTVQWARRADFGDAVTATNIPWPTYTHSSPLASGTYQWHYRFVTRTGAESGWSIRRGFTVPADATEFPMPTRAEQRERVPKGHPRLFLRPEDLPRLRELAKGREAGTFATLRANADRIIAAGPTPEPEHMGSAREKENKELVKYWWPNRTQTEKACMEAETLAFVYLMTGDKKYGEAARKWVLHLASWDPDGPTNFKLNCEAGKPMLFRPARAYDWAWDMFSPEDRAKIQAITQRRIRDAWESGEVGRGVGHLNRPYNSHGNRVWHKIAEAGIAFLDEIPEAPTWLDYAVNKFYAAYPVWSDDDGGWHEGVSYWSGYIGKSVWWLQVAQSALRIDGLKKPFFAQVGAYPLYIAPPHSPNSGFGDLAFRPPSSGVGGFMEYFLRASAGTEPQPERAAGVSPAESRRQLAGETPAARSSAAGEWQPTTQLVSHAPYWRWWTETWGMRGEGGILGFLYDANLPPLPAAKPPTDLPQSKIFHGIGVASLHTTLLDSRDDVHFLFKSSPFGSQSHGHNPQNTFQLNAYGEALLTTCGYRDLHGSKFHFNWVHSTVAHNGVLVNGEGQQKHVAKPQGRIVAEQLTPAFDYICGDATPAYAGRLTRAKRHVIFVKGDMPFIVLYDDLEAREPSTFQFMLHALKPFTIDEKTGELSVEQPKAGVIAKYFSPMPLSFRQWDGFEPSPDKEFPNQWHVEAGTKDKRMELSMITVLVPHRAGQPVTWRADRKDTADGLRVRITLAGKSTTVTFPKSGATGPTVADNSTNR
jgi:hypothetical protein